MKNFLITASIFLGSLFSIAIVVFFFVHFFNVKNPTTTPTGGSFPSGGGSTQTSPSGSTNSTGNTVNATSTMTILDQIGRSLSVNDFTTNPRVIPDASNKGNYILGGGLTSTSTFEIYYWAEDKSFDIGLFTEPIGPIRKQAEQELMQLLGIDQQTMCSLRYWVGVSQYVNQFYSGKNLGFSFCSGATQLPNQ